MKSVLYVKDVGSCYRKDGHVLHIKPKALKAKKIVTDRGEILKGYKYKELRCSS